MKIINKTNNQISIQVKGGTRYTVEANGELRNVPTEHAEFWKGLHQFLILEEEITDTIQMPEVKEEEVLEEVKEEIKEEEIVEEVEEVIEEEIEEKKEKKSSKKSK